MSGPVNNKTSAQWQQIKQQLSALAAQLHEHSGIDNNHHLSALQQRTMLLAQVPVVQNRQLMEVLRFNIGMEHYAIESGYVAEVLPLEQITTLFGLPLYIAGICYVRGKVVSVVDLRILFQLPGAGLNDRNMLVLLKLEQMEFGLLCDEIVGIQQLDVSGLQSSLPNLDPIRLRYLHGITHEQAVLLNAKALLTDPELIVSQESA